MRLSKATKTVVRQCSKLNVGDLVLTTTPGDTARVLEVHVGDRMTKLVFGCDDSKSTIEYDNHFKIIMVEKNSLN